jgi:hypothetical protein
VYGCDSHGMYAEGFDAKTGKCRFRFCTCYWFNFSEAWGLVGRRPPIWGSHRRTRRTAPPDIHLTDGRGARRGLDLAGGWCPAAGGAWTRAAAP